MTAVEGFADPAFSGLRDLLQRNLDDGTDVGASLCVVAEGETVVDLWGGVADVDTGTPWVKDTVVNTYSLTKTMTTLAALLLVDRGQLDLDAPVARYWPEFAANGKGAVLVRHVLGHTSGVSGWQQPVSLVDICDAVRAEDLLAEQAPWWEPGTASGYHATNFGHLVGGMVRRVTGVGLGEFFATEVAAACGADYLIGVPADVDPRIAPLIAPPPSGFDYAALPPDGVFVKTMANPVIPVPETSSRLWRSAEIGGANGHGNARSVALVQSVVSHGGRTVSGSSYCAPRRSTGSSTSSPTASTRCSARQCVSASDTRCRRPRSIRRSPTGGVLVDGYGGSIVVNDLDRRMTFAYVMNKMSPQLLGAPRTESYVAQAYAGL
ncbi:serine hydrolase [Rhodococcus hoagii]|nr:serine hydrolase [Prescottella equi]